MAATAADLAAQLRYGPQTTQLMRRSQYLADALKQINTTGGESIRSPLELAAKLAATAVLSRASNKAQDATLGAVRSDREAETESLLSALRGPKTSAAPQPAAPASLASQPAPPQPQQAPQPSAAPSPASANNYSARDRDALTRMLATEAIGEGPQGMAAAGHVAVNRLRNGYGGAKSLADVVMQPNQFEGMSRANQVRPQDYEAAAQVADAILQGQLPDPTNGAMNFLNPQLQSQMGRRQPSWAPEGQGQRIGNHVFYGGRPQQPQSAPDVQMASAPAQVPGDFQVAPTMASAQQSPPSFQVAANGPLQPGMMPTPEAAQPSAPGLSPLAAGGAPAGLPPQANPAGESPQRGQQWPTYQPTEAEIGYVQELLTNPRTYDQGRAAAMELRQKMTQPAEAKIVEINGAQFYVPTTPGQGGAPIMIPVPREAMTQSMPAQAAGLPNAPAGLYVQRDPLGNLKDAPGAPPQGYEALGGGGLAPQRGGPADPMRPQAPAQGYQFEGSPNRQVPIQGGPADPRNPANLIEGTKGLRQEIAPIVQQAVNLQRNINAVRAGVQQQNGSGDLAAITGLQKLIDEGVVQAGEMNNQLQAQGLAGGIAGIQAYLQSSGKFDPAIRRKLQTVAESIYAANNGTLRDRVLGYRPIAERAFGEGSFDGYVLTPDVVTQLGWGATPQAAPQSGAMAPTFRPGTADAGLAEAVKRGMRLTPQQQQRARDLGITR